MDGWEGIRNMEEEEVVGIKDELLRLFLRHSGVYTLLGVIGGNRLANACNF